ncbi:hypothetical protein PINS_up010790 [Pythium insidiosum]|nr:hypothetical protein PINS_up010790 [Pythium insidiosum]
MNDECHADSDAQATEHTSPSTRVAPQQLSPREFQERLTAHLGPVVRAYESGALHLPTPPAANAAMRTKMDKCVAEATHHAVDKASGLASSARFNEALVWIFDQCLAPL